MEGKAKILVFGFTAEEQQRIDQGLASLGVPPALKMRPSQQGMVLRRILAGEGEEPERPDVPAQERLVLFDNVSAAGVQALMRFFREAGVRRPIFAVVTPTSIDWTLGGLLAHLLQERAALEKGR